MRVEALTSKGLPLLPDEGRPPLLYLDFWASWCVPCRISFPWLNQMHERYAGRGLRIVGINLDRREADALRFLQATPAAFELLMDPAATLARRFEIQAMPSAVLVAPDRRIVLRHRGFSPGDRPLLERAIAAQLARA